MAQTDLRSRAKRAYELERLRLGVVAALPVVPLVALSMCVSGGPKLALSAGILLAALAVCLRARGQAYGRALMPGLLAGTVPLLLPMALRASGHCCVAGVCWPGCMMACIGGGLVAGLAVGITAAGQNEQRGAYLISAVSVAGLTGALGCAVVGVAGLVGMALAICLTSVPISFARLRA